MFSPDAMDAIDRAWAEMEPEMSRRELALRDCMANLPEKSQTLLALRYSESLKLEEIAEKIGRTLSAAHKALSRLRVRLEDCITKKLVQSGARS